MPDLDLPSCEIAAISELTDYQQWVCWQSVSRNGAKPTKVPISPLSSTPASTTDKRTWSSYSQAVQMFVNGERINGVGFVLSENDPFVAVDLDDCRDPKTGELTEAATKIVNALNSYTEVSPSGKGLHIFTRGTIPERGRRSGGVEMYSSARYLTVTGWHVSGYPETINEATPALLDLFKQFPQRKQATHSGQVLFDIEQEPPADKFSALLLNSSKFKHTWEHKRSDLSDQSLSAYDLSLASQAAQAEWNDQEIASLIIAHRKKYGSADKTTRQDYFSRTIARARTNVNSNISEQDARSHASLEDAIEIGGEDALSELSSRFNVSVAGVIKRGKDPAFYYIQLADGEEIRLGEGKALNSQLATRTAIMNATMRQPKRMKSFLWDKTVDLMLSVAKEEGLADGESAVDMACLILAYLEASPPLDWDHDDDMLTHNHPFQKAGMVWVHAGAFIEWASIVRSRRFERAHVISRLREIKMKSRTHVRTENKKQVGRYYWGILTESLKSIAFPEGIEQQKGN